MWRSILLCTVFCFVVCVSGSGCKPLEGKWYNQLGSEMIVNRNSDTAITGEYRTAVERYPGAAGSTYSVLKGVTSPAGEGSLIGFSVIFKEGSSATSWIGECLLCGEDMVLETTWVLRTSIDSCGDRWRTTLINQDTFREHERVEGPRKHLNTHTPNRTEDRIPDSENKTAEPPSELNQQENTGLRKLAGKWFSASGSELSLSVNISDGAINGTYLEEETLSERKKFHVTGFINPKNSSGAFGLTALSDDSETMAVWVGQYFLCETGEVLDTSTLRRVKAKTCNSRLKSTNFGLEAFSREQPGSTDDYENSKQSDDYETPKGSDDYETPKVSDDYETPKQSNDYETPKVSDDYETPKRSDDYETPKRSDDYETPKGSDDYETPKQSDDYETPKGSDD